MTPRHPNVKMLLGNEKEAEMHNSIVSDGRLLKKVAACPLTWFRAAGSC